MLCTRILFSYVKFKPVLPVVSQLQLVNKHAATNNCRESSHLWSNPAIYTNCNQGYQAQYCTSAAGVVNSQDKQQEVGILKRMMKKVGLVPNTKMRLKVASNLLYESVADKINYIDFFRDFNMPNTFNSWFLVTELHVWLLLVRSMAEGSESGDDGRYLRNNIVEAMWGDVNTRAKKLGASNPSRTRQQIQVLSEQFQAALISYDEGVMSDDRILAASLWRRFFGMNCDDYTKIERLVKYVREQIVMLDNINKEEFLHKVKIPWITLDKISI